MTMRVRLLSTEEWVRRLNILATKIDEYAAVLHPSMWHEQLANLFVDYEALTQCPTYDPEDAPQQVTLDLF